MIYILKYLLIFIIVFTQSSMISLYPDKQNTGSIKRTTNPKDIHKVDIIVDNFVMCFSLFLRWCFDKW